MRRLPLFTTLLTLLLLCAGPAHAAQRYASPTSNAGGGCEESSPCELEVAIEGASDNDDVIVLPGTYMIDSDIQLTARVDLYGLPGYPRPVLVGLESLELPTLTISSGSLVRHLTIDANGDGADGLTIKAGALVENIWVTSASGDGAKINGDPSVTILRDSAIHTSAHDASHAAIKLRDGSGGGNISLTNVTAWAVQGNASGIRCETNVGRSVIVNTLVRGAAADLDASVAGAKCDATYSNLRSLMSSGLALGTGISGDQPLLHDPANGDFRPVMGSPTIDAGTTGAFLGLSDPDGRERVRGAAPDVGAFEHPEGSRRNGEGNGSKGSGSSGGSGGSGAGAPAGTSTPALPGLAELPAGVAPPVLGKTVVLAPASGVVLVRKPGGKGYTPLRAADDLPVGTIINATRGTVRLSTALDAGHQTGSFRGGAFEVRQAPGGRGMTDLLLRGGSFRSCRPRARKAVAVASAKRPKTVRRLWGSDRAGRFRTRGRNSVATVRGTSWLTEDRCDGTLTRVTEGAVDVRDLRRGTTVLVRAGRSRLVRGPR